MGERGVESETERDVKGERRGGWGGGVRERESVYVCVCERESEREGVCV